MMKAGNTAILDDVCSVEYGTRVVQKRDGGRKYPVYGGGGATFAMDEFNREDRLIVSRFGMSEQCTRFVEGKFFLNDSGLTVSPKTDALLKRYLDYHILALNDQIFALGKGSAQKNLDVTAFRKLVLYIPNTLPEQERIVGILDEAFDGIAKAKATAEANLQNARALFQSHLQTVFSQQGEGWVETTLDKISTNLDSQRIPITKSDRKAGQYPYYGASGIVDYVEDYIFDGDTLLISEDGANLLARSTPIAFSVSGRYWVNNHAHILKFEDMATQRYVEFYIGSIRLDEYITGAAQPKLNQRALNSIPIPIPTSVTNRSEIVQNLESIQEETQRLESLYQNKLNALDELKKSLLHQAFNGNL
jgi:type I restriction enzyme S subunit